VGAAFHYTLRFSERAPQPLGSEDPMRSLTKIFKPLAMFALLLLAGLLPACGGGQVTVWDAPSSSEAESAYREALAVMESGQYIEAMKQFNELRLKFPFSSRWTTLAELRLADIQLKQSRNALAAESYRAFINSHPTHEEVPYAYYQIGLAYYDDMPSDIFLLPRPWQRELDSAEQAEGALKRFVEAYPDSKYVEEAMPKLDEVRERLARHQLYVAEFYEKRGASRGAMNRLTGLLNDYETSPVHDQALFLLARTYMDLNDFQSAAGILVVLTQRYPESDFAEDARVWLAENNLSDAAPFDAFATPSN